jgi:hypothetical protein
LLIFYPELKKFGEAENVENTNECVLSKESGFFPSLDKPTYGKKA